MKDLRGCMAGHDREIAVTRQLRKLCMRKSDEERLRE